MKVVSLCVRERLPDEMTLLARDAFIRTNRRAIAIMFVRLSVCLFVWHGRTL